MQPGGNMWRINCGSSIERWKRREKNQRQENTGKGKFFIYVNNSPGETLQLNDQMTPGRKRTVGKIVI